MALTKISTDGVKDDAVTAGKIPANAVGSSELADNAVDTAAIADDAVTADKIANSINTAIAANTAKTTNATHTGDVTGSSSLTIASNAVVTSKILDGAINNAKVANDAAIAGTKIAPDFGSQNVVTTGTVVADNTAGRNMIINGDMTVAQRATSKSTGAAGNTYDVCDRWSWNRNGVTATIAQVNEAPDGSGFTKSFKFTTSSAVGSIANGNMLSFGYKIETQDVKRLGYGHSDAKTATLSFWVRGSLSGKVGVSCTRDSRIFSANEDIVANTWKFVEIVIPADTSTALGQADNNNGFGLQIVAQAGGSFNSGATNSWIGFHTAYSAGMTAAQMGAYLTTNGSTFQITGVQLEIGNTASNFAHESYAETLRKCKRYYQNHAGVIGDHMMWGTGRAEGNTGRIGLPIAVPMRASPTVSTSTHRLMRYDGSASDSTSTPTALGGWFSEANIYTIDFPGHSLSHNNMYQLTSYNARLTLDAEL